MSAEQESLELRLRALEIEVQQQKFQLSQFILDHGVERSERSRSHGEINAKLDRLILLEEKVRGQGDTIGANTAWILKYEDYAKGVELAVRDRFGAVEKRLGAYIALATGILLTVQFFVK